MFRAPLLALTLLALVACEQRDENQRAGAGSTAPAPATQPTTRPAAEENEDPDDARLYGVWKANNVDTSIGPVDIQLTFKRSGKVRILAWSEIPLVGQVRNKQAPYEVTEGKLHSSAIENGSAVQYRFGDQGELLIRYTDGRLVTFRRV